MSDLVSSLVMIAAGVSGLLGAVYPAFRKVLKNLSDVRAELKPNGGGSLRDRVEKMITKQRELNASIEGTKRAAFDLLPAPVFEAEPTGECRFVNLEYCDRLGITRDQALGHGWIAFVHGDDRERVRQTWDEAVRDSRPFADGYRMRNRQTNAIVPVDCRAVPVRGADGAVLSYVGFLKPKPEPQSSKR